MALKLSNNANGILALAISDSDTSLTLRAGQGSRFPVLSSGYWFPITVVRASDPSQFEIMRCIARSGDTLTVVRAQEGTAAIAFDAGDVVSLRLTAGTLQENFVSRSDLGTAATRDVGTGADQVPTNGMLGTAATHDVTTSPTDTTPGRVLKVGDFGVGEAVPLPPGVNLNTVVNSGFYRLEVPVVNAPAGVQYGQLIVSRGHDTILQIVSGYDSGEIYWRQGNPPNVGGNGSWSGWYRFFHSGNIAQLISDGNLVQTSRTISTGTGLTGGGNLSANRTISLASSHWPIGVGQTWQDVTSQRSLGTTYTNTTGRPIAVSISMRNTEWGSIIIGGVNVSYTIQLTNNPDSMFAIVPPGSTYRLSGNGVISRWAELR